MAETQVVKVQHGCGCMSGCAMALGLLVLLGPFGPLLTWGTEHAGLTLALIAVGAMVAGFAQAKARRT